jgi:hypothetical protein
VPQVAAGHRFGRGSPEPALRFLSRLAGPLTFRLSDEETKYGVNRTLEASSEGYRVRGGNHLRVQAPVCSPRAVPCDRHARCRPHRRNKACGSSTSSTSETCARCVSCSSAGTLMSRKRPFQLPLDTPFQDFTLESPRGRAGLEDFLAQRSAAGRWLKGRRENEARARHSSRQRAQKGALASGPLSKREAKGSGLTGPRWANCARTRLVPRRVRCVEPLCRHERFAEVE